MKALTKQKPTHKSYIGYIKSVCHNTEFASGTSQNLVQSRERRSNCFMFNDRSSWHDELKLCLLILKKVVCIVQCGEEKFALKWRKNADDNQTCKERRRRGSDFVPNKEETIEWTETEKEQANSYRKARNVSRNVDSNNWGMLSKKARLVKKRDMDIPPDPIIEKGFLVCSVIC